MDRGVNLNKKVGGLPFSPFPSPPFLLSPSLPSPLEVGSNIAARRSGGAFELPQRSGVGGFSPHFFLPLSFHPIPSSPFPVCTTCKHF